MTSRVSQRPLVLSSLGALLALACAPDRACAQWGFGSGWGWGWGAFRPVPVPITYLNQKSLVDAARGYQGPTGNPYSFNPNAYINRVRDDGYVVRHDVARRERSSYRSTARSAPAPGEAAMKTMMTAAQPHPALPLASFYHGGNQLVWPRDAPSAGDLADKKKSSDQASLLVLTESKNSGVASMAAVADARQKLLDYGRPALEYVRAHETPRIADAFHLFLLSLYESLAQAATPAAPTNPATPAAIPHS